MEIEEEELVRQVQAGKEDAFKTLFTRYYRDLVLFAGKFLSPHAACEDAVQTVFMHVWDNRRTLFIDTSVKSFLLKALQNHCLNSIRRQQYQTGYETSLLTNTPAGRVLTPEHYLLYSDFHEHVEKAIGRLPEKQKEAFMLNRFRGYTYTRIAEYQHVSLRTVESRISEALKQLRRELKDFFL